MMKVLENNWVKKKFLNFELDDSTCRHSQSAIALTFFIGEIVDRSCVGVRLFLGIYTFCFVEELKTPGYPFCKVRSPIVE